MTLEYNAILYYNANHILPYFYCKKLIFNLLELILDKIFFTFDTLLTN